MAAESGPSIVHGAMCLRSREIKLKRTPLPPSSSQPPPPSGSGPAWWDNSYNRKRRRRRADADVGEERNENGSGHCGCMTSTGAAFQEIILKFPFFLEFFGKWLSPIFTKTPKIQNFRSILNFSEFLVWNLQKTAENRRNWCSSRRLRLFSLAYRNPASLKAHDSFLRKSLW